MNRQYPMAQTCGFSYANVSNLVELGKLGTVVGLCGAGAVNLHRIQHGSISRGEALVDTLKVGVATGLATAAAGLVGGQFRSMSLSLLATLATGTAAMYMLNLESKENSDE